MPIPTPNSSPVRLVATDLDGTLLRSDQIISDRTYEVLAQAHAADAITGSHDHDGVANFLADLLDL